RDRGERSLPDRRRSADPAARDERCDDPRRRALRPGWDPVDRSGRALWRERHDLPRELCLPHGERHAGQGHQQPSLAQGREAHAGHGSRARAVLTLEPYRRRCQDCRWTSTVGGIPGPATLTTPVISYSSDVLRVSIAASSTPRWVLSRSRASRRISRWLRCTFPRASGCTKPVRAPIAAATPAGSVTPAFSLTSAK